ncbi:MAG TPA: lantibiotic dehydratase family protein, partial [Thermoanaerobaculia bacterium]|nr:lantibiotic dehydratase family protein [Thermoanaerobaculia bacterium]
MAKKSADRSYLPADFFAFRTPLLPYEELEAWSEGLEAPSAAADPERLEAAVAADRARLRARLAALAERPEIREAVFLASPSLHESLAAWQRDPESKKGLRAERALVRYFYRMAARATPFGLFSGCSVGRLDPAPGSPTRIAVVPRSSYERHTRLDMDYLFALCEDLVRDPAVREALIWRPNNSLYRAAGRLRYAEARLEGKVRSHHLVAVDDNDYLEEALRRASGGATAREIAEALVAFDPDGEVSYEEAAEFVTELIDSQILVSDLSPPVTGPEAIHDLIDQLRRIPAAGSAAERLDRARSELEALDAGGPGADPARYEALAEGLKELPTPVEMSRLFQLDMVKPGDRPALGAAVLEEIQRGLDLLYRITPERAIESLDRFRKDFSERYENREVPLFEALDEEVGIGFERAADFGAEASPLLRGIAASPPGAADPTVPWGRVQSVLLAKLNEAMAKGAREIEITDEDLERMAPTSPASPDRPKAPVPDGFHVMVTLAAASQEALDRGEFQVLFDNAGGPSGARLLGRFCHADPELSRCVEEHLRAEEAHRPGAVFAEVVHLPQGRIGNILARPVLRRHEIPFLGRSAAAPEDQIPVSDLRVSVLGQRIVLRSARLGREVVPRLTSAH